MFGGQTQVAVVSNYQLKGVVAPSAGSQGVAILSADNKPTQAVPVGREVVPGVTVKEVHPKYVLLSEGGVIKRVDLAVDNGSLAMANPQTQEMMAPPMQQPMQMQQQPPPPPAPMPEPVPAQMPEAPPEQQNAPQEPPPQGSPMTGGQAFNSPLLQVNGERIPGAARRSVQGQTGTNKPLDR